MNCKKIKEHFDTNFQTYGNNAFFLGIFTDKI